MKIPPILLILAPYVLPGLEEKSGVYVCVAELDGVLSEISNSVTVNIQSKWRHAWYGVEMDFDIQSVHFT